MKKKLKVGLLATVLCLTLFSCGNADLTIGGNFNGIIADYASGTIDSIKVFSNSSADNIIGICAISSDGKFSTNLSTSPGGTAIGNNMGTGVVVSDPATIGTSVYINVYKNKAKIGSLLKCNFTHSQSSPVVGDAMVGLLYVDRPCTIKGTYTSGSYTVIYDLSLVKGWNELAQKITAYSKTATTTTQTITATSIIPSDLKWRYFSTANMQIKRFQLPGIK